MKLIKAGLLKLLSFMGRTLRPTILARSEWLTKAHTALSLWIDGSNQADVGPFHVRFDPRDRVIRKKLALYGSYEKDEIQLLCSLVIPGDVVMDIGANFGLHSLYLSRAVGSNGKVLAFEPDPDNFALLCANLEANGCANVLPFQYALGEKSGDVELFQTEEKLLALLAIIVWPLILGGHASTNAEMNGHFVLASRVSPPQGRTVMVRSGGLVFSAALRRSGWALISGFW